MILSPCWNMTRRKPAATFLDRTSGCPPRADHHLGRLFGREHRTQGKPDDDQAPYGEEDGGGLISNRLSTASFPTLFKPSKKNPAENRWGLSAV
jgi:hypothetical protein